MPWSIATPPTLDAQALQDLKQQVRELSNSFDDELTRKLNAAVEYIQGVANRQLLNATVVLTRERFPRNTERFPRNSMRFYLPPSPLVSVTSVQYIDGSNISQTWNSSLYDVVINQEPGYLEPAWDETYPENSRDIEVTYVSGYGTDWASVDQSVLQTVLMYADELYRGIDWGDLLRNQINHVMVGDDFHATYN